MQGGTRQKQADLPGIREVEQVGLGDVDGVHPVDHAAVLGDQLEPAWGALGQEAGPVHLGVEGHVGALDHVPARQLALAVPAVQEKA